MKKLFITIAELFFCIMSVQAQNDTVLNVNQILGGPILEVCKNKYDRVVVYAVENCEDFFWYISGVSHYENPLILDKSSNYYGVNYIGCGINSSFGVRWHNPNVPSETTESFWKHQYEPITLEAVGADSADMYTYYWPHSGETTRTIDVTNQGNYQCLISDMCATTTRTKIVNENVEIDLATCDLESNLNLVTWQTNPAQAMYIDHVIVKRDGLQVGTADYSDGQFIDNIGSDAASRTYTVTALATDGTPCPITSHPKETIHMAYLTGINNTIEVNWNAPTGYELLGYNICEWNANDGTLTTIDYVGASVTSYTCQQSQFDQGYVVIQGVEAGKDGETRLLSNRSSETVGIGENESPAFKVYPNPAQGTFTVEGTGQMTITNVLGQTVLTRDINGKETIELPRGIYFVKLNGATRKIVVE